MQKSETAKVLVYVQSVDRRSAPDQIWVEAWHELIGHLTYEQAMTAVRSHYLESSRPVYPSDILAVAVSDEVEYDDVDKGAALRLGVSVEEYVERFHEPGFIESLERRRAIDE